MARAVRSGSRADIAVTLACAGVALLATILPTTVRESVAAMLRQSVLAPVIALQAQAERARAAFLTRDATAARIDSLVLRNAGLSALEHENDRLRRLLGLARELRWGFVPAEVLHGRKFGDEHTLILTAGASAGLTPNSAVVAPEGVVGIVTTVDPATSTAILWTSPDFRASATTDDGRSSGIIGPHLGDGVDRYLLELRGVPYSDTLAPGTLVRTSGLGGIFPRGIMVGEVLGELQNEQRGWSRTYLVRPAVLPSDVSHVMVLQSERVRGDLSAVWASPRAADSARAAVVRAAQAMARDSARRDSIAPDSAPPPPADSLMARERP